MIRPFLTFLTLAARIQIASQTQPPGADHNPKLVNEARYGIQGGTTLFFPQVNRIVSKPGWLQPGPRELASGGFALTNATVTNAPSRRHSPVRQFTDNLSWVRNNHSFTFMAAPQKVTFWNQAITPVPSAVFTTSSTLDPAGFSAFSSLPATQQAGASQLYYLLAGRMTALNANARLDENSLQYAYLGDLQTRAMQKEYGIYGQDSWRVSPNLTLNFITLGSANASETERRLGRRFQKDYLVNQVEIFQARHFNRQSFAYTQFSNGASPQYDYTNFMPTLGVARGI